MIDLDALLATADRAAERARSAGADEAEAHVWASREAEANVVGRLASSRASTSGGLGLRVVVGARMGHAGAWSTGGKAVGAAIADALDAARALPPPKVPASLADPTPGRGPAGAFDAAIAEAAPEQVVREARGVAAAIAAAPDARFGSVLLQHAEAAFAVASTRGVQAADRGTFARLFAECRIARGAEQRTGTDHRLARRALDLAGAGEGVLAQARGLFGGEALPPGPHDVVFDAATSIALFQPLAHAVSGAEAAEGRSAFAGKVGQRVASPLLTVRDAPSAGGARSAAFDDEGTPSRDTPLLEAGVLRGFLHDARSARRSGTSSTGSALRTQEPKHRAPPLVAPMDLRPEPGPEALDDLVAQVERGVLVRHYVMGLASINNVTGDLSLAAPAAWWVERGEVRHPLRPTTVAGNALRALGDVVAVARETSQAPFGTLPGVWVRGLACAT